MNRFIVPVHYSIGFNQGPRRRKKYCHKYGLSAAIELNENSEKAKGPGRQRRRTAMYCIVCIVSRSSPCRLVLAATNLLCTISIKDKWHCILLQFIRELNRLNWMQFKLVYAFFYADWYDAAQGNMLPRAFICNVLLTCHAMQGSCAAHWQSVPLPTRSNLLGNLIWSRNPVLCCSLIHQQQQKRKKREEEACQGRRTKWI